MKQIIICSLLFLISSSSFCQQKNSQRYLTELGYLDKAKKQKTIGSMLLATGAGFIAASIIIPKGDLVYDGICVGAVCDDKYKNDGIKNAFFIAASISALSSIPLFIVSGKNRRKATSLSFDMENTIQWQNKNLVHSSFPAFRVKINF